MSLDEITFTLSDPDGRLSIDTLKGTIEKAMNMLRSMEADFVAAGQSVRWEVVRVQRQSPFKMTVAPIVAGKRAKSTGRKIIKAIFEGIDVIEKRSTAPKHFNEDALRATKELVAIAENEGATITLATANKKTVTLTDKGVRHIDELVAKVRHYVDVSTIEGRLEVVSIHERESFSIWETLTGAKVDCLVAKDKFDECLKLLGRRVGVTGKVRYRNHVPNQIEVEEISALPESDDAVKLSDIPPINIAGDLSPEEFVRRLRDA